MRFEEKPILSFLPLQSELGKKVRSKFGLSEEMNSFIIVTDSKAYEKFGAVLKLGYFLGGWFRPLSSILYWIVPTFIGNFIYSVGWRYRSYVFGYSPEFCIRPRKETMKRFLIDFTKD